ncbi:MAG: glycerophosphoryl diester phosphodiesterase membrane domain-containing protein [Candidatus Dormibacteria bacterium]
MQSSPPALRLRPLRVTELIDTVFSLYRQNFWLFVAVIALVQVPYQVVADLLGLTAPRRSLHATAGKPLTPAELHTLVVALVGLGVLATVLMVINIAVVVPLQTAAFTRAVADRFLGVQTSAGDCYRFAIRRWGALVLLGLLYLVLMGAALLLLGVVAALWVILLGKGGWVLAVLWVLVGLVAAIVVYVRLVVVTPALVLEGLGPWEAIRRSWKLTSGHAGRAFGVMISLVLVELLIGLALGIVIGVLVGLAGGAQSTTGMVAGDVSTLVVGVLTAPILASGLTLLYFDLRVRKEAFDLELLAQQISLGPGSA